MRRDGFNSTGKICLPQLSRAAGVFGVSACSEGNYMRLCESCEFLQCCFSPFCLRASLNMYMKDKCKTALPLCVCKSERA